MTRIREAAAARTVPALGLTGTGGSGKSSLTDELVRRFRVDQQDKLRIAVIAVDPTRRKGGGALLGDRIRMSSLDGDRIFFRSLATRCDREVPDALSTVIDITKAAGFDLVVVETPGIGQGDPHTAQVLGILAPGHEPLVLETLEHAGQTGLGQQHVAVEVPQPQSAAIRPVQRGQHLELAA